jgi:hypothetical protein
MKFGYFLSSEERGVGGGRRLPAQVPGCSSTLKVPCALVWKSA